MPWDDSGDFIRSGHRDPGAFDSKSMRTITIDEGKGIKAVIGCPKGKFTGGKCSVGTEVQSFLFEKAKDWSKEKAQGWFKDHEGEKHAQTSSLVSMFSLAALRQMGFGLPFEHEMSSVAAGDGNIAVCFIALPAASNNEAPTAFPIWPITDKDGELNIEAEWPSGEEERHIEKFCVDAKSVSMMLSNWQRRGIELMGDYEHQSLRRNIVGPVPGSIVSWQLGVQAGPDGKPWIWATNVIWTDLAAQLIRRKEYRYFSPAFDWDKATKRVTMMLNVGLTNLPATNNMPALIAASMRWIDPELSLTPETALLHAPTRTAAPNQETMHMAYKLGERIQKHMADKKIDHEGLAKHLGISVDSLKGMMAGGPDKLTAEHHGALKKLAEHMGEPVHKLRALAMDEDFDGDKGGDGPPKPAEKKDGAEETKAAKALGDQIAALSAAMSKVPGLEGQLAQLARATEQLTTANMDRAIEMCIAKAKAENRLFTPDQEKDLREDIVPLVKAGTWTIEKFTKHLGKLSQGGPGSFIPADLGAPAGGAGDPVLGTLTQAELLVAKYMKNDPKELAKFKTTSFVDGESVIYPGPQASRFDLTKLGHADGVVRDVKPAVAAAAAK